MDYVLPELRDLDAFMEAIEHTFANHHELEEAEAAFFAAQQGNKTIEEFNILFNSLLRPLQLDDRSQCKADDKAIDSNLVKLALIRGPWNDVVNLQVKQEIAVAVSCNLAGVTKILDPKFQPVRSSGQPAYRAPPPPPSSNPKPPDGDAMDLDEVSSAMKDAGFTYADFRQKCVDRNICIRCGGSFDDAHYQKRGCTLGRDMKMDMSEMLELWKEWGGLVRKKKAGSRRSDSKWAPENLPRNSNTSGRSRARVQSEQSKSPSPVERPDKGKKRESLAEVDGLPFKKRAPVAESQERDPVLSAEVVDVEDMSAGEVFFNTCMSQKMSSDDV
ncbi:hypothetical protein PTTG_10222, partial [Puccinia triticina 1-1 BBBD Race 1]